MAGCVKCILTPARSVAVRSRTPPYALGVHRAYPRSQHPTSLFFSSTTLPSKRDLLLRRLSTSAVSRRIKQEAPPETRLAMKSMFQQEDKTKESFLEAIDYFTREDVTHRRGHVEFIYAALKSLEEYGLQR